MSEQSSNLLPLEAVEIGGTVNLDPTIDFIAGTFGGLAGLAIGFPLDTVKVRFQDPITSIRYKGLSTFSAVAKIVREERVRGLYKGIASPMAGCAFMNGLVFSSYGFLMRIQLRNDIDEPNLWQIGLAGAGSGIISTLVTCPTDLIKIRQQALIDSRPRAISVVSKIIRTHGLRGLYRGAIVTALRDCGYGAYFVTYEGTCRLLRPCPSIEHGHSSLASEIDADIQQLSWPRLMLAGGVAGIVGWTATFGLDVVKTRVQASENIPNNPHRTMTSTIIQSYRTEGLRVFFLGLAPTMIRAIPVNMATFGAFEFVRSLAS